MFDLYYSIYRYLLGELKGFECLSFSCGVSAYKLVSGVGNMFEEQLEFYTLLFGAFRVL